MTFLFISILLILLMLLWVDTSILLIDQVDQAVEKEPSAQTLLNTLDTPISVLVIFSEPKSNLALKMGMEDYHVAFI